MTSRAWLTWDEVLAKHQRPFSFKDFQREYLDDIYNQDLPAVPIKTGRATGKSTCIAHCPGEERAEWMSKVKRVVYVGYLTPAYKVGEGDETWHDEDLELGDVVMLQCPEEKMECLAVVSKVSPPTTCFKYVERPRLIRVRPRSMRLCPHCEADMVWMKMGTPHPWCWACNKAAVKR